MLPAEVTEHTIFRGQRQRVEMYTLWFPSPNLMVTKNKAQKKHFSLNTTSTVNKQQHVLLLTSAPFHVQWYLDFVRPVHPAAYQSRIRIPSVWAQKRHYWPISHHNFPCDCCCIPAELIRVQYGRGIRGWSNRNWFIAIIGPRLSTRVCSSLALLKLKIKHVLFRLSNW